MADIYRMFGLKLKHEWMERRVSNSTQTTAGSSAKPEKDYPMLLAPEIRYEAISVETLRELAASVNREFSNITVTGADEKFRPTGLQSDDLVSLKLQEDHRKKPFMVVGRSGAMIAAEHSTPDTVEKVLGLLSTKIAFRRSIPDTAALGVLLTLVFIVVHAFIRIENFSPDDLVLNSLLALGSAFFFVGLGLFSYRSLKQPLEGRSKLALWLFLPGLLMTAPLSLLNIPLVNYLRREQGRRMCHGSLAPEASPDLA